MRRLGRTVADAVVVGATSQAAVRRRTAAATRRRARTSIWASAFPGQCLEECEAGRSKAVADATTDREKNGGSWKFAS